MALDNFFKQQLRRIDAPMCEVYSANNEINYVCIPLDVSPRELSFMSWYIGSGRLFVHASPDLAIEAYCDAWVEWIFQEASERFFRPGERVTW